MKLLQLEFIFQTKADQLAEHQAAQSVEPHVEEASSSESEVGPSIQMLNDDCLAHVFSFLTKRELVAIERGEWLLK